MNFLGSPKDSPIETNTLKVKKLADVPVPDYIKPFIDIDELIWSTTTDNLEKVIEEVTKFIDHDQTEHIWRQKMYLRNCHIYDKEDQFHKETIRFDELRLMMVVETITTAYDYRDTQRKALLDLLSAVLNGRVKRFATKHAMIKFDLPEDYPYTAMLTNKEGTVLDKYKEKMVKTNKHDLIGKFRNTEIHNIIIHDDVEAFKEFLQSDKNEFKPETFPILCLEKGAINCYKYLQASGMINPENEKPKPKGFGLFPPKNPSCHFPLFSDNLELIKLVQPQYDYNKCYHFPAYAHRNNVIDYMLENNFKIEGKLRKSTNNLFANIKFLLWRICNGIGTNKFYDMFTYLNLEEFVRYAFEYGEKLEATMVVGKPNEYEDDYDDDDDVFFHPRKDRKTIMLKDNELCEAFFNCASFNNLNLMKKLFERFNIRDDTKEGKFHALTMACKQNNLEMVKLLVEHGTNVNQYAKDFAVRDSCAIAEAIRNKNMEMTKYLLSKGADADFATNCEFKQDGIMQCYICAETPLQLASQAGMDFFKLIAPKCQSISWGLSYYFYNDCTPLTFAVLNNDMPFVKYLVETCKFDVNNMFGDYKPMDPARYHHDCSNTYLDLAIKRGYIELAKYLTERGSVIQNDQYSALVSALNARSPELVKFFLEAGCDPKWQQSSAKPQGGWGAPIVKNQSIMESAIACGNEEILDLLISKTNSKIVADKTFLGAAMRSGNYNIFLRIAKFLNDKPDPAVFLNLSVTPVEFQKQIFDYFFKDQIKDEEIYDILSKMIIQYAHSFLGNLPMMLLDYVKDINSHDFCYVAVRANTNELLKKVLGMGGKISKENYRFISAPCNASIENKKLALEAGAIDLKDQSDGTSSVLDCAIRYGDKIEWIDALIAHGAVTSEKKKFNKLMKARKELNL